ncbi:MAG: collagen-like protein [Bacilli bacterium]|nr:collagen-like protein [Bacilli bacterium]
MAKQILGKVAYVSKGTYNNTTKYDVNDVVAYLGSSYVSLKETQGNLPIDENFWQLIAEKGDIGPVGPQGIQGVQGIQGETGPIGPQGPKPVVGFDYFTEEDKTEIVAQITDGANSDFNKNYDEKIKLFDANANTKQTAYDTNATSKLKTYNDNHTEKLEEYNNNHDTKLAAYNQNADDKMNDFDENVENQIKHYNNSVTDFETVLDVVTPKQSVKGSEIVIDDALPLPIFETKIEGKSYQDTTAGKNKIGFADMTEKTVQGVTASILDNVISLSGQNSQIYAINVSKSLNVNLSADADTSCTLSYKVLNGQKNVKLGISFRDENDTQLDYMQDINATDLSTTKVISADTINKTHYFNFFVRTQEVLSDLKIIVQLEFNSAATEVEMYTGGQPSPSPEYSQENESISSLVLNHSGKNLIHFADVAETSQNGITYSIKNNLITLNGTATDHVRYIFADKFHFENSGNYVIDIIPVSGTWTGGLMGISTRDSKNAQIQWHQINYNDSLKSNIKEYSSDVIKNANRVGFYVNSGVKVSNYQFYFQLRKSDTVDNNTYETYREKESYNVNLNNNNLSKIADIIDEIIINKKSTINLIKRIKNHGFSGSESWFKSGFSNSTTFVVALDITSLNVDDKYINNILSNYFRYNDKTIEPNTFRVYKSSDSSIIYLALCFDINEISTLEQAVTWIQTNNPKIQFVSNQTETLEIGQLSELIRTFEGTNHFWLETNLDTEFEVKYALDIKKYIDKQNGLQDTQINEINTLLSSAETSAMLLDNYQKDLESEV